MDRGCAGSRLNRSYNELKSSFMSAMLQALLDIVGDPDRPDLAEIRAPMQGRIAELDPQQRRQLYDECFAAWKNIPREDSKRYYRHFLVFQYLSKATRVTAEPDAEQLAVLEKIRRDYAERKGEWFDSRSWLTPEEVAENIKRRNAEYLQG
jgi:hypothetical protein